MSRKLNLKGKRFGRLVGIEPTDKGSTGNVVWEMRCDCGNVVFVSTDRLTGGKTKSCGCYRREFRQLPKGEAAFNHLFSMYRCDARRYGRKFSLTKAQFKKITKQVCFYCGVNPVRRVAGMYKNGDYLYNGVDRINNTKDYTLKNCVPCCKHCNYAKRKRSKADFYTWIKRLHKNLKQKGEI